MTQLDDTARTLEEHLSPEHLDMLRVESGISDEVILIRGYPTIRDPFELEKPGFIKVHRRVPGLLLPLHTTDGNVGSYVYRPDRPRRVGRKRPDGTKNLAKYEHLPGVGVRLDSPPICQSKLADPSVPLWITEGQKKADSLASRGLCAVALLGVWNWKGKNDLDRDRITNRKVGGALSRMRFKQEPRPGGRRSRLWKVTLAELEHWAQAYSLPLPKELASLEANGTNGTDGTMAQMVLSGARHSLDIDRHL